MIDKIKDKFWRTKQNNENAYLHSLGQNSWNELHAYHMESAAVWRMVAVVAIMMLMLVSIFAMYFISQDKHKTLIYERDSQDNIHFMGLATKTFAVDDKIIAHQLASFILALREVPQDINLKRRNIDTVHKMISENLLAYVDKLIIGQYTSLKNGSIVVKFTSLKPMEGGKSWEISWTESNTADLLIKHWSALITFKRLDSVKPDIQLVNPIGLFITYINLVEDINDKTD